MEATFAALNQMVVDGVIGGYAVGGAAAVAFYAEPVLTEYVDVLVMLPSAGLLVTLEPIYAWARTAGYPVDREHVIVEGVPVQFVPVHDGVTAEGLANARRFPLGEVEVPVLPLEHLLAIMVKLGRPKDIARNAHVLETAEIDEEALTGVLHRHGLDDRWRRALERISE